MRFCCYEFGILLCSGCNTRTAAYDKESNSFSELLCLRPSEAIIVQLVGFDVTHIIAIAAAKARVAPSPDSFDVNVIALVMVVDVVIDLRSECYMQP